jgi:hypothetical protein
MSSPITLEALFTSRNGFGITTASPLQRAVCRASDGLPLDDLWACAEVRAAFGEQLDEKTGNVIRTGTQPTTAPKTMCVISGIRAAKSTLAAAKVYQCSQIVDLEKAGVRPGDEVRIPVLSTGKDSARATFTHISGAIMASPVLRKSVIGEPTADTLWLKHPSGFPIEVKVTALSRYGSNVISRWFAGIVFDEAPRMSSDGDFVLNLTEARRAAAGRILPNGQEWLIGSPYVPEGPVYDLVAAYEGHPNSSIIVVRAPGPAMNPYYWTPERCADLKVRDPVAHRTDVLAKFMRHPDSLFDPDSIAACSGEREPFEGINRGQYYEAYLNPSERSAHWSLIIATCHGMGGPQGVSPMLHVVDSWTIAKGSAAERIHWLAEKLAPFKLDLVNSVCDVNDTLDDLAQGYGIIIAPIDQPDRLKSAEKVSAPLDHKTISLPPDPLLRSELISARRRVTATTQSLYLPVMNDRAGDFVPLISLLCEHPPEPPDEETLSEEQRIQEAHIASLVYNDDMPNEGAARRLMA